MGAGLRTGTPPVVTMIDGRIDGDTIMFYNHIDTPPNPNRKGIQRNVMTGTITGGDNTNVMKFKWVSEGSSNSGEIMMIGPIYTASPASSAAK